MGWREANPVLAAGIAIDEFGNYVIQGFLFAIIAFGIVNTVLMSVMHRQREFGVLQAQGLTPGQTGTIVLIEGLTLSAVSGLAGVGLGLLGTWYFFGDGLDTSIFMQDIDELTFSGAAVDPVIVPIFGVQDASSRSSRSFSALAFSPRSIRRCARPGSTLPRR